MADRPDLEHVGRYVEHDTHGDLTWTCTDDCPHLEHTDQIDEAA